jgi:WD40 repeat protein
MKKLAYLILLISISFSSSAFDFELSSAVKHPVKNEIFIGGTFKTIIVIDSGNGKTLRTFAIDEGISDLQFTPDGSTLLATGSSKLIMLNPDSGEVLNTVNGYSFQLFELSPYFTEIKAYGDTKVNLYSSITGELLQEIKVEFQPKNCAFDKDFKNFFILSSKIEIGNSDEKKSLMDKVEKSESYNCYNSAYLKKQEDGYGSYILQYNIEKKEVSKSIICPFDFSGTFAFSMLTSNDQIYIADWNMFVKVNKKNISSATECKDACFAYAANYSEDRNFMCISSTKSGNIYDIQKAKWLKFDLRQNYEFAYSTDIFSFDEKFWILSKDYTLISMSYLGEKADNFKIDDAGDEGFNVYYNNGYSKIEDRNKEAVIINTLLTEKSIENINLEDYIGESDVTIANFKTHTEAEIFCKSLKDNKLQYITKIAPADRITKE